MSSYNRLPNEEASDLPSEPPAYEASPRSSISDSLSNVSVHMEQFEMDDPMESEDRNIFNNVTSVLSRISANINTKIIRPLNLFLIDPILQFYQYINLRLDIMLGKVGNPLIIRRFLYISFISGLIYFLITSGLYPLKGGIANGRFNNHDELFDYISNNIDNQRMQENLHYISNIPRIASTSGDLAIARYINSMFDKYSIDAKEFDELNTFVNYPKHLEFKLMKDEELIHESILTENSTSDDLNFKSFNFLTNDGELTKNYIYVNYARNKDFDFLTENQISVSNSICLARIGKIGINTKIEIAQKYNCRALVFFKDPQVLDLNNEIDRLVIERNMATNPKYCSGDVLTPGWETSKANPKLKFIESKVTPKIPIMTISYNDAIHFLNGLQYNGAKITKDSDYFSEWDFKNNDIFDDLTYRDEIWTGDSNNNMKAYLRLETTRFENKPIWNIIGKIDGSEQNDKAIIIGAKRDSTCYEDASSTVVLLELIDMFDKLKKKFNFQPLRSIYFISIDATEYNYAGITEWIEQKFREIKREIYAYVDLSDLIVDNKHLDVYTDPVFKALIESTVNNEFQASFQTFNKYGNYYPFLSFIGVPCINFQLTNHDLLVDKYSLRYPKGSCFNDYNRIQSIDPDMNFHKKLVLLIAKLVIRLVDEPIIPYNLRNVYDSLHEYFNDLEEYFELMTIGRSEEVAQIVSLDVVKHSFDIFLFLHNQLEIWRSSWSQIVNQEIIEPSMITLKRYDWNTNLISLQSNYKINENGVFEGRPWIKNMIFAPQFAEPEVLNKDGKEFLWWTFPNLRDLIDRLDFMELQKQTNMFGNRMNEIYNDFIRSL